MAWLIRDEVVLAAVETRRGRWRRAPEEVVVVFGPALAQTVTTPLALDVAWCTCIAGLESDCPRLQVRRVVCLAPWRVSRPQVRGGAVIVAPGGAFERWQLRPGDLLEVQGG